MRPRQLWRIVVVVRPYRPGAAKSEQGERSELSLLVAGMNYDDVVAALSEWSDREGLEITGHKKSETLRKARRSEPPGFVVIEPE